MNRVPGTFTRSRATHGAGPLTPVALPDVLAQLPGEHKAYRSRTGLSVFLSREPARAAPGGIWLPDGALELWHISVSHASRYPTWDEVADVRYMLVPDDVTMALLLPPRDQYVNVDGHCFHLWQIDDRRVEAS